MERREIQITYEMGDYFLANDSDTKEEIIERAQRIAGENGATLSFVYDETNDEVLFK